MGRERIGSKVWRGGENGSDNGRGDKEKGREGRGGGEGRLLQ